jgi:hypothetical protein
MWWMVESGELDLVSTVLPTTPASDNVRHTWGSLRYLRLVLFDGYIST